MDGKHMEGGKEGEWGQLVSAEGQQKAYEARRLRVVA